MMGQVYTLEGIANLAKWNATSRTRLLDFLATMKPEDFAREVKGMGHKSIRNTLVHMAEGHDAFVGAVMGARGNFAPWKPEDYPDVAALRGKWDEVTKQNWEFLRTKDDEWLNAARDWKVFWQPEPMHFAPAWAILTIIAHDQHHKGQIVFAARLLGYKPPVTDLMWE